MKAIFLSLLLMLLTSCSSENDIIDSSPITNYTWVLNSFKTSVPIDLNRDGVTSTDMVLEFECIKNEGYSFLNPGMVRYFISGLNTEGEFINGNFIIFNIGCIEDEELIPTIPIFGDYKMIDSNKIKFKYHNVVVVENGPVEEELTLVEDKLIKVTNQLYPTNYDSVNQRWIRTNITTTREYIKAF
ncbi:hypothetical protein M0M57_04645 [Flavobacterium azooxidireducens]|uniref:Lipoprotein n=1 Tax=Flavobacterium azooxidireducens TaxID=1871076 RepID=A0ABY4KH38_9FLAO|nr:hypothetical protein [Flavobacterium azooxidireducens]UPQ80124.1 hypothetical protein M0M57_04645 [Flavobacterium azooxidireducens]